MKLALFLISLAVFIAMIFEAVALIPNLRLVCVKEGTKNTCQIALANGW